MAEQPAVAEWVEVWRQPDGFWRWRYRDSREMVDLLSNESYDSPEHAVRSASIAYPGVTVIELPSRRPRPALARPLRVAAVTIVAALGLVLLVLGLVLAVLALPLAALVYLRRLARRLRGGGPR
jgi:hypothetical protein